MRSRGRTVTYTGRCVADVTKGDRQDAPALLAIAGAYPSGSEFNRARGRLPHAAGCCDTDFSIVKKPSRAEDSARPQMDASTTLIKAKPTGSLSWIHWKNARL